MSTKITEKDRELGIRLHDLVEAGEFHTDSVFELVANYRAERENAVREDCHQFCMTAAQNVLAEEKTKLRRVVGAGKALANAGHRAVSLLAIYADEHKQERAAVKVWDKAFAAFDEAVKGTE